MWNARITYLAVLLGAVLFHTFYTLWFSWYLLLLVLLLPLVSLAAALLSWWGAKAMLILPSAVERGKPAELTILVHNTVRLLPVPAMYAVVELDSREWSRSTYRLSGLAQNVTAMNTDHCSVVQCSITRCAVLDYLQLFRLPLRPPAPASMLVMPIASQPQPEPDLYRFQCVSYRVKRSGSSEIHEFREYRPGDSMRDVHWKLSAKTGDLIVREPQEPERGTVLISCDIAKDVRQTDSILDRLLWVSDWLLAHDIPHDICWQESNNAAAGRSAAVSDEEDLRQALAALLQTAKCGEDILWHQSVPAGAWHYHIGAEEGRNGGEKYDE